MTLTHANSIFLERHRRPPPVRGRILNEPRQTLVRFHPDAHHTTIVFRFSLAGDLAPIRRPHASALPPAGFALVLTRAHLGCPATQRADRRAEFDGCPLFDTIVDDSADVERPGLDGRTGPRSGYRCSRSGLIRCGRERSGRSGRGRRGARTSLTAIASAAGDQRNRACQHGGQHADATCRRRVLHQVPRGGGAVKLCDFVPI